MKCINKYTLSIFAVLMLSFLCACKKDNIPYAFERNSASPTLAVSNANTLYLESNTFAKDLCIDDGSYYPVVLNSSYAAGLFDINKKSVLYGQNMYEELTPASITKLLTALVVLKHYDLTQTLTFTDECKVTEAGAQKLGLEPGDKLTVEQALNILLLFSANDVANLLAVNCDGGYVEFLRLMKEEAEDLGATHTNFVNPHGLTEEGHASTVYDLYLILNELTKNEKFLKIVNQSGYTTSYTKADGTIKTIELKSTNLYLNESREVPAGYTVIGGKTGSALSPPVCSRL